MFLLIVWEATGAPRLFPKMDAEVVLAALGPGLTQLSLRSSYRPPLGSIGRLLDRALLPPRGRGEREGVHGPAGASDRRSRRSGFLGLSVSPARVSSTGMGLGVSGTKAGLIDRDRGCVPRQSPTCGNLLSSSERRLA